MQPDSSPQNPFAAVMAGKSSADLQNVITNSHKYQFEACMAAIQELERRQETTPDLLEAKSRIIETEKAKHQQQKAAELEEREERNEINTSFKELFTITRDYFFTPLIVYANVLVFIVMVVFGVNAFAPSVDSLIQWGGNLRALTLDGELWRLFTSTFMHGGIIHLLFNMYAALQVGFILETNIGKYRYIVSYLACGILASIASIAFKDNIVSVGASGAIFGLYGLLLSLLITKRLNIPQEARKNLLTSTSIFIGYNLMFGFAKEGIDNAAHIGGLISGFLIGFIYNYSMKRSESSTVVSCAIAGVVLIAAMLSPYFISNKYGEFRTAMEAFSVNEEKALWMYKSDLPVLGNETASYIGRLQTEGIDLWEENLSLLNSLTDMPDHLQKRIDLLKKYCALRIQSCEIMRLNDFRDIQKYNELESEINTVIKELQALNE
jgi:rhomboid protease GluP